jgi:glutamate synthase (NADPH/NADH) small chain
MTAKDRMEIPPQTMPEQDAKTRARNMNEVALGYTAEMAKREASRCMQCPTKPCMQGCPVAVNIPGFLAKAAEGDFEGALATIRETSLLPAVCGRVCPQEKQCQKFCTMGKLLKDVDKAVAIGRVERFCADNAVAPAANALPRTGKRIAVIGSGPASITCAADCARAGHDVTVFEAFHKAGGVLVYGIPEFRLPKAIVKKEIDGLKALGVKFEMNYVVGRTRRLRDFIDKDGFDAVFIGTGAGLPKFMDIEGENLVGVFSANEYLTRANLMKAYDEAGHDTPFWHGRRVAVLGGGNVAMDASRMALRLGADKVYLIYRRSEAEMPARKEEVHHAKEEGVEFLVLQNAKRVIGDDQGRVAGLECLKYELGEPDASGRRSPVAIPGSEFTLDVDTVVVAVGNASNPLIPATTEGLEVNKRGNIVVDPETNMTSIPGVFAGGDIVLGAATVILAMGEGRRAAAGINAYAMRRAATIESDTATNASNAPGSRNEGKCSFQRS